VNERHVPTRGISAWNGRNLVATRQSRSTLTQITRHQIPYTRLPDNPCDHPLASTPATDGKDQSLTRQSKIFRL
jgi:hypothetical protein